MSAKTKAGQIWTDSVAYVALLTGAGLSIAGNVANVLRTRGDLVDALDVVLAVAFPALVVLMVEVFVSSRWRGLSWPMQVLRWMGTLSIGAVAMRVSWVHLNELMLSRGQSRDVSTLGPLAIDCLAIMATALILAGRGQVPAMTAVDILANRQAKADTQASSSLADEAQHYLERLAGELDSSTTAAHPVSPAPMSNVVKPESVPVDATHMLLTWAASDVAERPTASQADALVAAAHNVSTRTARRWRDAVLRTSA